MIPEFYMQFGDRLPARLWAQHAALGERLAAARGDPSVRAAE
jgi:phosphoenolpyruvate carboxykinase (GTP)